MYAYFDTVDDFFHVEPPKCVESHDALELVECNSDMLTPIQVNVLKCGRDISSISATRNTSYITFLIRRRNHTPADVATSKQRNPCS